MFARLGLGSVLGYLVAGVVIGPSVLGLTGEATDVMHFAEFGVTVMLFLVGLELQPEKLWELRKPIFGLGGLQVVLTAVAIGVARDAVRPRRGKRRSSPGSRSRCRRRRSSCRA